MNALAKPIPAVLEQAARDSGLTGDGIESLKTAFAPHFIAFTEAAVRAKAVPTNAPKQARTLRLELKEIRVAAEHTRKALKEDSLLRGRAIDGIKAVLDYQLKPIEDALEAVEKAEERREAARIAALKADRAKLLAPFASPEFYDLGNMPAAEFDKLLAGAKAATQARIAAEENAKAERERAERAAAEERAKQEAAQAAERVRMKAENERLAKVAAEERKAREAQETAAIAERQRIEAENKKQRAEAEAREQALRDEARRQREEAEARATEARIAREKVEAEMAERTRVEAARIAKEKAAAKKAAAAPDRQKLQTFATQVRSMRPMALSDTPEAKALAARIDEQCQKFATWVEAEAEKL